MSPQVPSGMTPPRIRLDFLAHVLDAGPVSMVARDFGTMTIARVFATRPRASRPRRHLTDGGEAISVVVSGDGRFPAKAGGGRDILAAESRGLASPAAVDGGGRAWSIVMDRAALEPLFTGDREPLRFSLRGDNPALHLLDGYLSTVFELDGVFDPTLTARHVRDLALGALGFSGDIQMIVRERSARAARLDAVLDRLAAQSADPLLDPARFAAHLGVSVRYLHRLLEGSGRSFSEHLLACRLDRAAGMLRDPDCRRRIADIARSAGFVDISHFNRSFRRAFGDTPNGMRVRSARRSRAWRGGTACERMGVAPAFSPATE